MASFILNIFRRIEDERSRKKFLIFSFGVIGMFTSLFFAFEGLNRSRSEYYVLSLTILYLFTTANLIYFIIKRNIAISAHLLIISFFVFCIILFAFVGIDYSGVLWYFVFSPLSILLTDFKKGLVYNILLYLLTIFFIINPFGFTVNYYPFSFLLRFLIAYPIVNIFILIFEYARSSAFSAYFKSLNDVNEKNEELLVAKEELKKHNEELIKREKQLKDLNLTKDKLFSIIAHDLKSPFTSILGFSEPLDENNKKSFEKDSLQNLEIINNTAKKTLTLLDNLLNWAKSQTGYINYKPEKLLISKIIKETIEIVKSSVKTKNISINYTQKDDIKVIADPILLKSVLQNLICNSIKFTHNNGNVDITALSDHNQIEISVSDNGIGMSQETQERLFKIDTSISTPGTANEKGSGLGLLICKEFIEKQGGKIWVESEINKGSKFTFTLPMFIPEY